MLGLLRIGEEGTSFARRRRRLAATAISACLLAGWLIPCGQIGVLGSSQAATARAAASATASISGRITDASGNAITSGDVCVNAYSVGAGGGSGQATTDSSGNYDITGLPADSYEVYVNDCYSSTRNDLPGYYSTAADGSPTAIALTRTCRVRRAAGR